MMKFRDALYGDIDIQVPSKLLTLPEVQRLREVRLCNINSPYITGGANINRFEHAIGTCFLAQEYCKTHFINNDKEDFYAAALIHDIITPPFGHSLEYIFTALGADDYYLHANLELYLDGKTVQQDRPFFLGKKSPIKRKEAPLDVKKVKEIISHNHLLSETLDNRIDIDNIDNVFRLAYHIGFKFDPNIPVNLARNLPYKDSRFCVSQKAISLYQAWYELRRDLYTLLLESPGEFAAKALLERAIINLISCKLLAPTDWIKTDSEFVHWILNLSDEELGNSQSPVLNDAKEKIRQFMLMELPEYYWIFETNCIEEMELFATIQYSCINQIYDESKILLHVIRDVDKTYRPLQLTTKENKKPITIGKKCDRYLLGFFSTKNKADYIKKIIQKFEVEYGVKVRTLDSSEEPRSATDNIKQYTLF